jgi:hypothetical protein
MKDNLDHPLSSDILTAWADNAIAQIVRQCGARSKPASKNSLNPVLTDGTDGIIAGHGRVEAAKLAGMSDVPTVRVDHLTPAQIRAYVIADNKLAENAGWDRELLTLELQDEGIRCKPRRPGFVPLARSIHFRGQLIPA